MNVNFEIVIGEILKEEKCKLCGIIYPRGSSFIKINNLEMCIKCYNTITFLHNNPKNYERKGFSN